MLDKFEEVRLAREHLIDTIKDRHPTAEIVQINYESIEISILPMSISSIVMMGHFYRSKKLFCKDAPRIP